MSIYETATKVVIWLGPKADESGLAIDWLNYLTGKALIEMKPRESFDDLIERLRARTRAGFRGVLMRFLLW
jgi:hypothetical protein